MTFKGLFYEEEINTQQKIRKELIERVKANDLGVLREADITLFYEEILSIFVDKASTSIEIKSIVNYLTKQNLCSSPELVYKYIPIWSITKIDITTLVNLAALSNSAKVYLEVAELLLECFKKNELLYISKVSLIELIGSHYWFLGAVTRGSGYGFLLKMFLKDLNFS